MRALARVLAAACLLPVLALAEAGVAQQDQNEPDPLGRELTLNDAVKAYVELSGDTAVYHPGQLLGDLHVKGPPPTNEADAESELIAALRGFRLLPAKLNGFLQIVPVMEAQTVAPYVSASELAKQPPSRYVVTVVPLKHATMGDVWYLLRRPVHAFVGSHPKLSAVLVEGVVEEVAHRVRWIENIDRQFEVVSRVIECRNVDPATILEPLRQAATSGATVGVAGNQIVLSGLARHVDALAARLAELDRK